MRHGVLPVNIDPDEAEPGDSVEARPELRGVVEAPFEHVRHRRVTAVAQHGRRHRIGPEVGEQLDQEKRRAARVELLDGHLDRGAEAGRVVRRTPGEQQFLDVTFEEAEVAGQRHSGRFSRRRQLGEGEGQVAEHFRQPVGVDLGHLRIGGAQVPDALASGQHVDRDEPDGPARPFRSTRRDDHVTGAPGRGCVERDLRTGVVEDEQPAEIGLLEGL
jgi:hypothetical protein